MIIYLNRMLELREKWEFEEMANVLCGLKRRDLITEDEYKASRMFLVERAFGMFVLGEE